MIISFDLDDTLIPATKRFETESQNPLHKLFRLEKIRIGTIDLMKTLKANGHDVFIYTTSFRPKNKIWWIFFLYGIRIDRIINQTIHQQTLKEKAKDHSKYPPAFKIDIHIDDSKGVAIEGEKYHFNTIVVREDDPEWTHTVLQRINSFLINVQNSDTA